MREQFLLVKEDLIQCEDYCTYTKSSPEETLMSSEINLKELILNHFNNTENCHCVTASQTGAITRKEYLQREQVLKKEINKLRKKIKKLKNHK